MDRFMRTNIPIWLQKMVKGFSLVRLLFLVPFLAGCDELAQSFSDDIDHEIFSEMFSKPQETMRVNEVHFSPDYKTFSVSANVLKDIGPYELKDTTKVRTEVIETFAGIGNAIYTTPKLVGIRNVVADCIYKSDIRLLLLVDLTLSRADLERVRTYIEQVRTIFNHDNCFIAFMDSASVSKTMKLTDYVIANRIKKSPNHYIYLYRSILEKKQEMLQNEGVWKDAKRRAMLVFSNEIVYQDSSDEPIDPDHYKFEEQMVQDNPADTDTTFTVFYSSIDHFQELEDHEANVLGVFCGNHRGAFMQNFSMPTFKKSLYNAYHLNFPDNEFLFENCKHKVYRGDHKKLTLNFYFRDTDSLKASVTADIVVGSLFKPVIVDGNSMLYVITQGLLLGGIFMLIVWLVFQFIEPFIRYCVFRKKYVIRYQGANMSAGNKMIEERCYLCKAPFEKDDKIVVKCEHTMHKSCWDENNYHCPEYSDRCKEGSHYYNSANLLDSHNAIFYMKWILMAILSATVAWLCFTLYVAWGLGLFFDRILRNDASQLPVLGLLIGFFLTHGITALVSRPVNGIRAIGRHLMSSFISAIACYAVFMMVNLFILIFDLDKFAFWLNWIPWTLSAFIIARSSTFGTRIAHNKLLIVITVFLSLLTTYIWLYLFNYTELDYRVLLLLTFVVFSVGLTICIATITPRSEHYFLKVEGAVKGMDVALYKWFRNDPNRVVTIGRSVNCSLQLSWDLQGDVAPTQAEIRMHRNALYLTALEPGVFIADQPLEPNKQIRLHHGRTFTIGQTIFTYIEKDL